MSEEDFNPELDLVTSRIIRAGREDVWRAWTDPASLEQWWIPKPASCRVQDLELRPGGSFVTLMSEGGGEFGPHLNACFLAVDELERLVFTNALVGGWRPAESPFMTAVITFADHADGTEYVSRAMHKSPDERQKHQDLGFDEGWGTVAGQLAELVERPG